MGLVHPPFKRQDPAAASSQFRLPLPAPAGGSKGLPGRSRAGRRDWSWSPSSPLAFNCVTDAASLPTATSLVPRARPTYFLRRGVSSERSATDAAATAGQPASSPSFSWRKALSTHKRPLRLFALGSVAALVRASPRLSRVVKKKSSQLRKHAIRIAVTPRAGGGGEGDDEKLRRCTWNFRKCAPFF